MEIYSQIVTKVYHVKDGDGTYGKWRMWSLYLKGDDKKFTYFSGGKKPEPFEGMKIGYLKYTEKTSTKDGVTYNNYTIDEIKVSEESQPSQEQSQTPAGKSTPQKKDTDWDAIARGKCKFGFLQQAFVPYLKGELFKVEDKGSLQLLEENAELFADMCMRTGATTAPQTAKEREDIAEPAPDVPYDDAPTPTEEYPF